MTTAERPRSCLVAIPIFIFVGFDMSFASTTATPHPSSSASFLARVVKGSTSWTPEQRQDFRDFFCTDETDMELIARLGISGADLRVRRQNIAKLVQVTA